MAPVVWRHAPLIMMGSNTVEALNLSQLCLQFQRSLVLFSSLSLSVGHARDLVIAICYSSPVMWMVEHANSLDVHVCVVDLAPNVWFHIKLGFYSTACHEHCQTLS